jgi:lysophospholipase L1-like esterase
MFYSRRVRFLRVAVILGVFNMLLAGASGAPAVVEKSGVIRIAVVGDSTVCNYDPVTTDLRGWGQLITNYFKYPQAEVVNLARSGRSSKSFIDEGLWDKVLKLSPPPNYVLIQFAHNDDPSKGPQRATSPGEVPVQLPKEGFGSDPKDWYRNNIRTYIEQARAIGAVPVLVTSMERRQFRGDVLIRKNQPYAEAAIAVAKQMNVVVIDLESYSSDVYSELGLNGSEKLHFHMADSSVDNTHYSETGARIWAEFIVEQLAQNVPALKPAIALPAQKAFGAAGARPAKNDIPVNNNALTKSGKPSPAMFSDRFLAEVKARNMQPVKISLPTGSWDRILFGQVFSRQIKTDSGLKALAEQRGFIWGVDVGVVRHGGYGAAYYPSMRDFNQSRMFSGGSPVVHDLKWYQENKPEWVVYKADRTTAASGYKYDWGEFMPLDITRQDVREYILNTFLIPAIERGYPAIAFDNVMIHNLHKRCGVYRNGQWVQQYSGEVRDPVFAAAVMDYLRWMKREINARGAALALNAKVDPQQPEATWELIALADIWLDEGGFSNDSRKGIVDQPWEVRYNVSRLKAADGVYVGANTTGAKFEDIPESELTWILANFLLIRGERSYLSITGNEYTGELLSYPPEFNPPVGRPEGDSRKEGNVYVRDYQTGFVAVNPSSKESASFAVPSGNWTDRFGSKVSGTVTLTPRSGIILLKAAVKMNHAL